MSDVKSVIESGRAVLGIEFGSTRIKAVLVEENHDASKMMSFGKDVFFLSGPGTIPRFAIP